MKNYEEEERKEIVVIDVSLVMTSKELHQLLKKELEFPSFYGHNWPAFWDAITGLVQLPKKIIFVGWDNFSKNLPMDAEFLKKRLEDKNKMYPSTLVEVEYR
ncbi:MULTISPECIES: barstar family protein [Brevibacillus]|jgi:ribonuclease inhibitor|uniref:barstar family protein n=1 Tax=Brevibacillus TaxID=55080 RepID=UPI0007AB910E|nr:MULTISPECIES: barstar family protein [Brevibacillus]KZE51761.1 barnase inhibitor [Brevibacillus parabrevis]MDH6351728.1 ribonuclease inhibitor [Brevibacillus sp. 1238]MDR5002787.1 barstar family protein [Brevibacillus parabrevis]UED71794.1 barstar family protein [Brevibacillus sp. HD3.3A]